MSCFRRGASTGTFCEYAHTEGRFLWDPLDGDSKELLEKLATEDALVKLRNLKALLDEGVLTQEEFDAKKKEILQTVC